MLATGANLVIRLKFVFYGVLCFVAFIGFQLMLILIMQAGDLERFISSFQINVIFSAIIGAAFIELAVLRIIALPKGEKIKPTIKRSYKVEYAYFIILLSLAGLIIYGLFTLLDVKEDSVVSTYIAISFSNLLVFKMYLSYFGWELRKPLWTKFKKKNNRKNLTVSFLLPAYNEEKTIKKLFRSIDNAAAKYLGEVEIILVNDGSTDRTEQFAKEEMILMKYCRGFIYTIKNSGKGFALDYGLKKVKGEIVIRVDTDSVVDENIIRHIAKHYDDPTVGSVAGMLFPLREETIWQKCMMFLVCQNIFLRKEHNLTDSILVQPGAFSTFRTSVLRESGSWNDNQFGEDGDITLRLGRLGYRHIFEEQARAYSDVPSNFQELREQRLRWSIAFFHSRAKNMNLIKEFRGPRSFMLALNLIEHGGGYAKTLFYPFLAVSLIIGDSFSLTSAVSLLGIPTQLVAIDLIVFGLLYAIYFRYMYRFRKLYLVKLMPFMRVYFFILSNVIKPEALEILLLFSSKYKYHTAETQKHLIKLLKQKTGNSKTFNKIT
jgi:cellulose synthase/poly-beta-1,6-N-acetylglucosamine synthase-like glycosyltransferase